MSNIRTGVPKSCLLIGTSAVANDNSQVAQQIEHRCSRFLVSLCFDWHDSVIMAQRAICTGVSYYQQGNCNDLRNGINYYALPLG